MNVFIARIAAAVASAIIVWIVGILGLPVTEEQVASAQAWLTTGITGLGLLLWGLGYAGLHKLISRRTNPADTAKAPELAAARIGEGRV